MSRTSTGPVDNLTHVLRARALQTRDRPAAYGPDVDVASFGTPAPGVRSPVASLQGLAPGVREAALLAGIDSEEEDRASYFQSDASVLYERIQWAYRGQLELLTAAEALRRYAWVREYWWQAVAVDTDKYTAAAALAQTGGFCLRVFAHQRVDRPIQACLFVQENNISQNVHNLIILEEGAEARLITGCALHPQVDRGLHIGVTEVFLKPGATLADTMIHNWAEGFHVRPRTAIVADAGATYLHNYLLLHPVQSVQAYPSVVLRGDGARAQFHTIIVGLKDSMIDLGACVKLCGRDTQAQALSRAVAWERATMVLRGQLIGRHNESRGHLDCRGMLLSETAQIHAIPELIAAGAPRSALSHEAAVGPIAEDVVEYLMTRGMQRDEAMATLVRGFLQLDLPGLPKVLRRQLEQVLAVTAERSL